MNFLTVIGLILWYIGVRLEKYADYFTDFLKKVLTNLFDSGWFYFNQAGTLLEKSENLLELSIKHLVIQWSLAVSISPGKAMFGMWKTNYKCPL